ncbi:MAG: CDGSH iron-sulfur domain-containing protein [Pseudomonadota bacterium]
MSEETEAPIIDMREDGPLLAKHLPELQDAEGNVLAPRPLAPLCRCGASSNKPYCDGSHRDIEFKSPGSADASKDGAKAYTGSEITVHYNKLLCSHAGHCVRKAGTVFDTKQRPWIDPDRGDSLSAIMEAVEACPSGALRYSHGDEAPKHIAVGDEMVVKVSRNGPLEVQNVPLAAEFWPEGATQEKYVLCRCGLTGNGPFCDGSHADEGWKDSA